MTLDITVDVRSAVPPFEQIRRQIATVVDAGLLPPGSKLPTIRALAADLGVAAGTVARAYTELEAAGVVVSRRRTGTVIAENPGRAPVGTAVHDAAAVLAQRVRADGLDEDAAVAVLRAALARLP
ncbi:GntR family transcriptional regulator [Geodermatophilus sp. FMUSA9-8]|uniref:GntR family transcriptional regulator n=1 Tax=Geodermatophilus sp. FMUSA9-8 TaxID=3120155 RepID=UPI003008B0A3